MISSHGDLHILDQGILVVSVGTNFQPQDKIKDPIR